MREISQLRKRADAVGCRVQVFRRKDYRIGGVPIRYALVQPSTDFLTGKPRFIQLWASNLAESRSEIVRIEHRQKVPAARDALVEGGAT